MYGVAGERRLTEFELPWLDGYEGSRPVRIGNGASGQRQLDVYGEVVDALYTARCKGLPASDDAWRLTGRSSSGSNRVGASRTRASGRYADRGATSPTRR